ncbi:hypothetical protein PGB90_001250 [Kerria lacca]
MKERIKLDVPDEDAYSGVDQQCPPPSIKVDKENDNLKLFGVIVGNNCLVYLPAFGVLFLFIGIILTIVAFKEYENERDQIEYENHEETTKNLRILGPVCILVGFAMLIFALFLKYLSRKAKSKQTRIGFYCPIHGDFYPLSPGFNPRKYSFPEVTDEKKCWPLKCIKKNESLDTVAADIPTCPHSISPSNRSSFDAQHIQIGSSNPIPIIITEAAESNDFSMFSDCNLFYASIRSLSVPNDVACFPTYRSRSNPPTSPPTPVHSDVSMTKRLSCPILPEIGTISPRQIEKLTKPHSILYTGKPELKVVQPAISIERSSFASHSSLNSEDELKKRKSVSILLPPEEYRTPVVD